ncbi:MAG: 2-keto-4-methylthiobutyrate aminotransferase [Rhodospirillaceae bacterium]|nr:MAG: 2-keto-4-methylthiobutyrate aminotransferase [Rhodospirillaceae bacterium]
MILSLNGVLCEEDTARIDPRDRGFTLGDGVFETIAVRNGAAPRLVAHLARLRDGLQVIGLALEQSDQDLVDRMNDVLAANDTTNAVLRLTVSRGVGQRGIAVPATVSPTVVITANPLPPFPTPARVTIAASTCRNEKSPLSRIKSLGYLDNIVARREADARGVDDAIMLNTRGDIACATVANVFLLVDGGLITPRVEDGALPGLARADVITLARAEERTVSRDELNRASEMFLTNALGVRPVTHIDNAPVGDGEPGLITQLLATRV